jgi:hypothetical protein
MLRRIALIVAVTQFALDDSLAFNRFAAGPSYTLQIPRCDSRI